MCGTQSTGYTVLSPRSAAMAISSQHVWMCVHNSFRADSLRLSCFQFAAFFSHSCTRFPCTKRIFRHRLHAIWLLIRLEWPIERGISVFAERTNEKKGTSNKWKNSENMKLLCSKFICAAFAKQKNQIKIFLKLVLYLRLRIFYMKMTWNLHLCEILYRDW